MELSSSDDIYSLKVDDFDTAQLLTNATRQRVYRLFSRRLLGGGINQVVDCSVLNVLGEVPAVDLLEN
jgi:hypothetical protein